ncbi:MAG: PQQ-binding-like beta-propeller repeat protein [Bacteroidia bacterium]|nr:PQQ-binding-like beta-propeller repeat protein [Bacteroidia bacterium]
MKQTKKTIQLASAFMLAFLLFACKKNPENTQVKDDTIYLESVWSKEMSPGSIAAVNSQGNVLVEERYDTKGRFNLLNATNGELLWTWNDLDAGDGRILFESKQIFGDLLVFNGSENRTYAVNMLTGATVWRHHFEGKQANPHLFKDSKDNIYRVLYEPNNKSVQTIVRTYANFKNWEPICTYEDTSKIYTDLHISNIGIARAGSAEEVCVFSISNGSAMPQLAKIIGYDTNKKSFVWQNDYSNLIGFSENKIHVWEEITYLIGSEINKQILLAINGKNGSKLWNGNLLNYGQEIIQNFDAIVVLADTKDSVANANLIAFDYSRGTIRSDYVFDPNVNTTIKSNVRFSDNISRFDNYIVSSQCKAILFNNINTLKPMAECFLRDSDICLSGKVFINKEKRLVFTYGTNKVTCFKLPVSINF